MVDQELKQFKIVVTIAIAACIVALAGRLNFAPMPLIGVVVSCLSIVAGIVVLMLVGRGLPLHKARIAAALVVLVGLTLVIAINGGMSAPAIVFLPAASMGALLLAKPRRLIPSILISTLPFLFLITVYFLDYQPDPVIRDPDQKTLVVAFWGVLGTGLIGFLGWRFSFDAAYVHGILLDQSQKDHLTGIANRTGINVYLDREMAEARRRDSWLSIVLLDIDHFKRYNDTNGHNAGDECLVRVAVQIGYCLRRPTDLAGRWGGEEFVVLLPDTGPEGAWHVAEKIRQEIYKLAIPYQEGLPENLTMSLGVASYRGLDIPDMEPFLEAADQALYAAKASGRNQTKVANTP